MEDMLLTLQVQIPCLLNYFILVGIFSVTIRFILNLFKTAAVRQGEADYYDKHKKQWVIFSDKYGGKFGRLKLLYQLFFSWTHNSKLDDYFLSSVIGIIELLSFPVMIVADKWNFIGVWLGIKTAAHWDGWSRSRTPFVRFLVGNALVIFVSFFLSQFVVKIPSLHK